MTEKPGTKGQKLGIPLEFVDDATITVTPTYYSTLTFYSKGGVEILRIQEDGMVFYKGRAIQRDTEIVDGLREMLGLPLRTL